MKIFLVGYIPIILLSSMTWQKKCIKPKYCFDVFHRKFQDTNFIKNYFTFNKNTYLYTKPNLNSKTKIKVPNNVMITTINKSGQFEYGKFNVSSTKSFRGWFLISDLQVMKLTPPKSVHN
jgi:hypothetical protein